jgi:hypothetical protein
MKRLSYLMVLVMIFGITVLVCQKLPDMVEVETSEETEMNSLGKKDGCTTIQSGNLYTSTGELIVPGYDEFGYNYQAHMFNGRYCDYDRVIGGDYCDVNLIMKWNDAWLSNKDCDGDGLLDRHFGFDSYIGSGAWCTNHQSGGKGKDHWTYFVKIVAVPADAVKVDDIWYDSEGTEIGPVIWGSFAVIQRVDSGIGVYDLSPAGPGFGKYKP